MGFLSDLVLKTVYYAGEISANDISRDMALPFVGVLDGVLEFLKREELVGIIGSKGIGERGYTYSISEKGLARAREALERSQYVGPAPVLVVLVLADGRPHLLGASGDGVDLRELAVLEVAHGVRTAAVVGQALGAPLARRGGAERTVRRRTHEADGGAAGEQVGARAAVGEACRGRAEPLRVKHVVCSRVGDERIGGAASVPMP